jgi:hypothetical protein
MTWSLRHCYDVKRNNKKCLSSLFRFRSAAALAGIWMMIPLYRILVADYKASFEEIFDNLISKYRAPQVTNIPIKFRWKWESDVRVAVRMKQVICGRDSSAAADLSVHSAGSFTALIFEWVGESEWGNEKDVGKHGHALFIRTHVQV